MKSYLLGNLANGIGVTANATVAAINPAIVNDMGIEQKERLLLIAKDNSYVQNWIRGVEERNFSNKEQDVWELDLLPIDKNIKFVMEEQLLIKYSSREPKEDSEEKGITSMAMLPMPGANDPTSSAPPTYLPPIEVPKYWNMNTGESIKNIGETYSREDYSPFGTDRTYFGISTDTIIATNISVNLSEEDKSIMLSTADMFEFALVNGVINFPLILDEYGEEAFIEMVTQSVKILYRLKNSVGAAYPGINNLMEILRDVDITIKEMETNPDPSVLWVPSIDEFLNVVAKSLVDEINNSGYMPPGGTGPYGGIFDTLPFELQGRGNHFLVNLWNDVEKGWSVVTEFWSDWINDSESFMLTILNSVGDHGLNDWDYQIKNNYEVIVKIAQSYSLGYNNMVEFLVEDSWFSYPDLKIKTVGGVDGYVDLAPNGEFNFNKKVKLSYSVHDIYGGDYAQVK